MKVIVVKNYDELSELGASIIAKLIKEKPNCTLGLATGFSFPQSRGLYDSPCCPGRHYTFWGVPLPPSALTTLRNTPPP